MVISLCQTTHSHQPKSLPISSREIHRKASPTKSKRNGKKKEQERVQEIRQIEETNTKAIKNKIKKKYVRQKK